MNDTGNAAPSISLARFAKLVVVATFVLVLIGGHTTTSGAGMAFPDWPLSHDSLNPSGWWQNLMQRLEHGHRLMAETVGLLIGVLCAWIWRSKWSLPMAAGISLMLAVGASSSGASRQTVAHVGLWSAVAIFAAAILWQVRERRHRHSAALRWLAFAAFAGVCAQAVLGGLRVTIETGGDVQAATTFKVLHGCCAQLELGLLVAIAAMLSPSFRQIAPNPGLRGVARFAWVAVGVVFAQLIVGAAMRHLGAGLAIPTFPEANPSGGLLPAVHNIFVDLNFTHTRIGAAVVAVSTFVLARLAKRAAAGDVRISRAATLLDALVAAQVIMGVLVIQHSRPPILTTFHVVNGAAVFATAVLLAVRATRAARQESPAVDIHPSRQMAEASL